MTHSPQRILVVPDLEILVCDRDKYQHNQNKLLRRFSLLRKHVQAIQEIQQKYTIYFGRSHLNYGRLSETMSTPGQNYLTKTVLIDTFSLY